MIFKLLFAISLAFAEEQSCDKIKNYHDLYHCTVEKHPALGVSKLKKQEGEALFEKSTQWKNPELGVKNVGADGASTTELSLAVPLSQIWTNGANRDLGRAEKNLAEVESLEALKDVKKQVLMDLYRLRQLEEEMDLTNEAIGAFTKVRNQMKERVVRGPEQEILLNLTELSLSDYELDKNHHMIEKSEILERLQGVWGPNFTISKELLPPLKEKWPEINSDKGGLTFEARRLLAESGRASAEAVVASRESWPEVSAGPVAEHTTSAANPSWSYGFNVSMTLPLFSLSSGTRKLAETKASQARLLSEYSLKKSSLEKGILIQKYRSAVESLKKSSSRDDLRKKHDKIDALFSKGLAGGALIIEAHRQINGFTESQHEHERSAIESYIEWKSLNGEDIEDILK